MEVTATLHETGQTVVVTLSESATLRTLRESLRDQLSLNADTPLTLQLEGEGADLGGDATPLSATGLCGGSRIRVTARKPRVLPHAPANTVASGVYRIPDSRDSTDPRLAAVAASPYGGIYCTTFGGSVLLLKPGGVIRHEMSDVLDSTSEPRLTFASPCGGYIYLQTTSKLHILEPSRRTLPPDLPIPSQAFCMSPAGDAIYSSSQGSLRKASPPGFQWRVARPTLKACAMCISHDRQFLHALVVDHERAMSGSDTVLSLPIAGLEEGQMEEDGDVPTPIHLPGAASAVVAAPDGMIYCAAEGAVVYVVNPESRSVREMRCAVPGMAFSGICLISEGRLLVAHGDGACVWDLDSGEMLGTLREGVSLRLAPTWGGVVWAEALASSTCCVYSDEELVDQLHSAQPRRAQSAAPWHDAAEACAAAARCVMRLPACR